MLRQEVNYEAATGKAGEGPHLAARFSNGIMKLGFGALTVESILDTVARGADVPKPASEDFTFEPYSNRTFFEQGSAATLGEGERENVRLVEGGLVLDINTLQLYTSTARGLANRSVEMVLSNNTMQTHLSQFDVGTYKRAHRHGPGSHVLSLEGVAYTLFWTAQAKYSDGRQHIRTDWKDGTLFVPPDRRCHQHFNTGGEPAKYMATDSVAQKFWSKAIGGGRRTHRLNTISYRFGGNRVDYPDEDPALRSMFEEELKKNGVSSKMPARK